MKNALLLTRKSASVQCAEASNMAGFVQNPYREHLTAIGQYQTLLSLSLDDGRLTFYEAETLTGQARFTGLTGTQLL